MRFNFAGKIGASLDEASKGYFARNGTGKNGMPYKAVNFSVSSSENNRGYVELFGIKADPIRTKDTDNNQIDIAWDDRLKDDVVDNVASYRKTFLNIDGDRQEFVSSFDAAKALEGKMKDLIGKDLIVAGLLEKNFYNGKAVDRFRVTNIYPFREKTKPRLTVTGEIFFTKDSLDTSDWDKEKKITVSAYTLEYIPDMKKRMYFARQIVFDASKVDFTDKTQAARTSLMLKFLGCALDGEKIKVTVKGNTVYKANAILQYVNGNEEIPFDESELTETQKEALALGLKTLDDFRPTGSKIYGDHVTYFKFVNMDMRDDYADGCVAIDETEEEFDENIYRIPSSSQTVDTNDTEQKNSSTEPDEDDDLSDLFG